MDSILTFVGHYWWLVFPLSALGGSWAGAWRKAAERRHRRRVELYQLKNRQAEAEQSSRAEVQQVLDGSWISLCLDTGHLLIGGTDPAELAHQAPERIAHVHFKDVDARLARRVQDGHLTYTQGVREGMYRPLGTGDVDVPAIVGSLRARGYNGWYVLEQDVMLEGEPEGEGPVTDVRASLEHLVGRDRRPATTSSRSAGSASTSTRCRSGPGWRTSRPSASTSAAPPPTSASRPHATATPSRC